MQDAPKTGSLQLDTLLGELSQLRIANAEREQEMSCIRALHELSPNQKVPFDDQIQRMIDLVPHGFLRSDEMSAQVRMFEHVFATPGFRDTQESHSVIISLDEQDVGELRVQSTAQFPVASPISLEKQRFLSLVADRFGECIRFWSTVADAEHAKQRLTEMDRLTQELDDHREAIARLSGSIVELSASLTEIWDGVLFIPLAGVVDSRRAAEFMDRLFNAVFEKESYFVIADLRGLEIVDTACAAWIIRTLRGVRFLGATGIITGVRPAIAATLTVIDVNLNVPVYRNLRDGLRVCIRRMKAIQRWEKLRQRAAPEK